MSEPDEGSSYHLFDGVGVEVEYAIVDRQTLRVRPFADRLLLDPSGIPTNEIEHEATCWSNELSAHVIELKSNGPATDLESLGHRLSADVRRMNAALSPLGAWLIPTAMHPLMIPSEDARLWPHGQNEIYQAYDRLFDCKGHGWSNLQSVHLNLPFSGDEEFEQLHAAIRILLPLLPALSASSPIEEGRVTGHLDTRLFHYAQNQRRFPVITGQVIPEQAFSERAYREQILGPIETVLRPLDPEEILEAEWVNSRGAIARFSRGSIELRVLDVQECPRRDLAFAALIVATLRALVEGRLSALPEQSGWTAPRLARLFWIAADQGGDAILDDPAFPTLFGLPPSSNMPAERIWEYLATEFSPAWAREEALSLVRDGCVARRILGATGPEPGRAAIVEVYSELCRCLRDNRPLSA